MNTGWVKLHRKTLDNIELMHDSTARLLFFDLLLLANSKGEVAESGRELAEMVGLKHSTLYKALKRLVEYDIIAQMGKHRLTIIVICNWNKYQSVSPLGKQQNVTFKPLGKQLGKQYSTDREMLHGKQLGNNWVNTGETDGKQLTGVARIENKNKESNNGNGYKKFQEAKAELARRKSI